MLRIGGSYGSVARLGASRRGLRANIPWRDGASLLPLGTRWRPIDRVSLVARNSPVARNLAVLSQRKTILTRRESEKRLRFRRYPPFAARVSMKTRIANMVRRKNFLARFAGATPRRTFPAPPRCCLVVKITWCKLELSRNVDPQSKPGPPSASFAAGMAMLSAPSASAGSLARSCTVSRNRFASRVVTMPSVSVRNLLM